MDRTGGSRSGSTPMPPEYPNASLIAVMTRWYWRSCFSSENICSRMKKHRSSAIMSPKVTIHLGAPSDFLALRFAMVAYAAFASSRAARCPGGRNVISFDSTVRGLSPLWMDITP